MKQIDNLEDFKTELKNAGGKLVLVDFYATWCGPCKQIAPKLEKFESTYTEVVFLKVDVDEAEDITKEYTITAMPTFKFFKNEKEVDEVVGASDTSIEAVLNKLK